MKSRKHETMLVYGKVAALVLAGSVALCANATPGIAIDSVVQRWPWNNKVDITYTVTDGQTLTPDGSGDVYCKIVFNATIAGQSYVIDGVTDVGASANSGTHTITWTPPANIVAKALDCTMTATLSSADSPSGDDYMVVDLTTGAIAYEGLLGTQGLSNARYNTDVYKTDKLVLRKVPKWCDRAALPNAAALASMTGYPTGDNTYYSARNSARTWQTEKDYYFGVFPVTQTQYTKLGLTNPSVNTTDGHLPVDKVSWYDLRRPAGDTSNFAPTLSIPAVTSLEGTFLQRLNYITGNKFGFDLPTEVMFEIAGRAGATTTYYWGDIMDTRYIVCQENAGGNTVAVGSRLPNNWGIYDYASNFEWQLDGNHASNGNLASVADPFTPIWDSNWNSTTKKRRCWRGSYYGFQRSSEYFRASARNGAAATYTSAGGGFRVSYIVK